MRASEAVGWCGGPGRGARPAAGRPRHTNREVSRPHTTSRNEAPAPPLHWRAKNGARIPGPAGRVLARWSPRKRFWGATLRGMEVLTPLASALGLGVLAGARLYATVFAVGLMLRFDWIALPAAWHHASALADTRVLAVSGVACAIEFIADKIPWVDSAWDSVHTFIRPIGAALLASSVFTNLDPVYQTLLLLLAGGVALSGHSAKAATRLAVNHSPEPFSNLAVSFVEDAATVAGLYLLAKHPWVLAGIALGVVVLSAWFAPRIYRAVRAQWTAIGARLRTWFGDPPSPHLTAAQQRWLQDHSLNSNPRSLFAVIATPDLRGFRNTVGTLCFVEYQAVFFGRRWGRLAACQIGPLQNAEVRRGLLVDEIALAAVDGKRVRFDLLAGQLDRARGQAGSASPYPAA